MNDARRKEIENAIKLADEARGILEDARDAEQEAFNNLPEGLQQGDKGQASEAAISELDDAVSGLETAVASAETAIGAGS